MENNELYLEDDFFEIKTFKIKDLAGDVNSTPMDVLYDSLFEEYGPRFKIVQQNLYWTSRSREKFDRKINSYIRNVVRERDKKTINQYKGLVSMSAPISFLKTPSWAKDGSLYLFYSNDVVELLRKIKSEHEDE